LANNNIYTDDILKTNFLIGFLKSIEINLNKYIVFFDNIIQTIDIVIGKQNNKKNEILELIKNIQYQFKSFLIQVDNELNSNENLLKENIEDKKALDFYKKQETKIEYTKKVSEYTKEIDKLRNDIFTLCDTNFMNIEKNIELLTEENLENESINIKSIINNFLAKIKDYQELVSNIVIEVSKKIDIKDTKLNKSVLRSLEDVLSIPNQSKVNKLLSEDDNSNKNAIINLEKVIDQSLQESKELLEKEISLKDSNKKDIMTISELIKKNLIDIANFNSQSTTIDDLEQKSIETENLLEELSFIRDNHQFDYIEGVDNLINSLKEQKNNIDNFINNEQDIKHNDYSQIENFNFSLEDSIKKIDNLKSTDYSLSTIIKTQDELKDLYSKFENLKKLKYSKDYESNLINILNNLNKTNYNLNQIYQEEKKIKKNNEDYIKDLKLKIKDNASHIKNIKQKNLYLDDIIQVNEEIKELLDETKDINLKYSQDNFIKLSSALQQQSEITKFLLNKEVLLKNQELEKIKKVSKEVKKNKIKTKKLEEENIFLDEIHECNNSIKELIKEAKGLNNLKYKQNFVLPLLKSLNAQQKKIKELLSNEMQLFENDKNSIKKKLNKIEDNKNSIENLDKKSLHVEDIQRLHKKTQFLKDDILDLYDLKYNSKLEDDINLLKESVQDQLKLTSSLLENEENQELNDKKIIYDLTFDFNSMFKDINYQDFYGLKKINDNITKFDEKINSLDLKYKDGLETLKSITQDKLMFINSNIISLLKFSFDTLEDKLNTQLLPNDLDELFCQLNIIVDYVNQIPKNRYIDNQDEIDIFYKRISSFYTKSNLLRVSDNINDLDMFCSNLDMILSNSKDELIDEAKILKNVVTQVDIKDFTDDFIMLKNSCIKKLDNIISNINTLNKVNQIDTYELKISNKDNLLNTKTKEKKVSKKNIKENKQVENIQEIINDKDSFDLDDYLTNNIDKNDIKESLLDTKKILQNGNVDSVTKEYKKIKTKKEKQKDFEEKKKVLEEEELVKQKENIKSSEEKVNELLLSYKDEDNIDNNEKNIENETNTQTIEEEKSKSFVNSFINFFKSIFGFGRKKDNIT
jgi:hypothetical protein